MTGHGTWENLAVTRHARLFCATHQAAVADAERALREGREVAQAATWMNTLTLSNNGLAIGARMRIRLTLIVLPLLLGGWFDDPLAWARPYQSRPRIKRFVTPITFGARRRWYMFFRLR